MTHIKAIFRITVLLSSISSSLMAQSAPPIKWGRVVAEEWQLTRCPYDTSASAVVLFDKGEIEFNQGQAITIRRHKRIKILSAKLTINYTLTPEEAAEKTPAMVYLKPLVINPVKENPFKNEARFLPVELDYPYGYYLTISIKIPDHYQVQELPASLRIAMPDQMAQFTYLSSAHNQMIQIRTTLSMKATTIPSEAYAALREFYTQVVSKFNEQIVLKKI